MKSVLLFVLAFDLKDEGMDQQEVSRAEKIIFGMRVCGILTPELKALTTGFYGTAANHGRHTGERSSLPQYNRFLR